LLSLSLSQINLKKSLKKLIISVPKIGRDLTCWLSRHASRLLDGKHYGESETVQL